MYNDITIFYSICIGNVIMFDIELHDFEFESLIEKPFTTKAYLLGFLISLAPQFLAFWIFKLIDISWVAGILYASAVLFLFWLYGALTGTLRMYILLLTIFLVNGIVTGGKVAKHQMLYAGTHLEKVSVNEALLQNDAQLYQFAGVKLLHEKYLENIRYYNGRNENRTEWKHDVMVPLVDQDWTPEDSVHFFVVVDGNYESRSPTNESYKSILAEMEDYVIKGHMQLEITENKSIEKFIHENSTLSLSENLMLVEMLDDEDYNVLLAYSIDEFNSWGHYLFVSIVWILFATGPFIYWMRKR